MRLTVSDLIENLLQMPQDAYVYVETEESAEQFDHVFVDDDGDVRVVGEHTV